MNDSIMFSRQQTFNPTRFQRSVQHLCKARSSCSQMSARSDESDAVRRFTPSASDSSLRSRFGSPVGYVTDSMDIARLMRERSSKLWQTILIRQSKHSVSVLEDKARTHSPHELTTRVCCSFELHGEAMTGYGSQSSLSPAVLGRLAAVAGHRLRSSRKHVNDSRDATRIVNQNILLND